MMHDERAWIDRVEDYGKRAVMHPELSREWAAGCSEDERKFFERLYEHRTEGGNVAPGGPAPRYVIGTGAVFGELSPEAQELVETACRRVWGHV